MKFMSFFLAFLTFEAAFNDAVPVGPAGPVAFSNGQMGNGAGSGNVQLVSQDAAPALAIIAGSGQVDNSAEPGTSQDSFGSGNGRDGAGSSKGQDKANHAAPLAAPIAYSGNGQVMPSDVQPAPVVELDGQMDNGSGYANGHKAIIYGAYAAAPLGK